MIDDFCSLCHDQEGSSRPISADQSWHLAKPTACDAHDSILYEMARVKACYKTFYDPSTWGRQTLIL